VNKVRHEGEPLISTPPISAWVGRGKQQRCAPGPAPIVQQPIGGAGDLRQLPPAKRHPLIHFSHFSHSATQPLSPMR